ncbi:MAG: SH3 domain-containing protein [Flavobacteriaceae bacterium]
MKNIFYLYISLFIISCSTKERVETEYLYKVNSDVNLRQKPSTKSKIIDVLKLNETVQVVDSVNGWYNITDNDLNSGYVSKKYINRTAKVSIIKEESFFSDNVIYIISGIVLLLIFWKIRRDINYKKHEKLRQKEQAKRDEERKVRLAALRIKKKDEDKLLSIEKNVTCDDGKVRKYNGFMYGILREQIEDIVVSSIIPDKKKANDFPFDNVIHNHKWFSEDGKALKSEEILAKQKEYYALKHDYEDRYRQLIGSSRGNPRKRSYLCCVNNTFFHAGAISKTPSKLFSGKIDGSIYVDGVLYKSGAKPDKNQLNTNNEVVIAENILFPGLKGVDLDKVEYNSTDLGKSLSEDINGRWYFTQRPMVMLIKIFSEEVVEAELKKLLKANGLKNIDLNQDDQSWSIEVDNHSTVGNKSTLIFERNKNVIQIINSSLADSDSIELKETKLAPVKEGVEWVEGLKIYDGAGFFKDNNDIFLVRNVPLFFSDDDLDYILIPCVPHLTIAKNIIDSILKLNGGVENHEKLEEKDDWRYVFGNSNFLIGYIKDQELVRINRRSTGIMNLKQLYNNLNLISEQWAQILKSRGSWRTMNIENLKMSYWDMAMGHTEEYMLKYENDDMDIEGITYRIDVLNSFIDEYEKYFKDRMDKGLTTSKYIFNDFLAIVESLIGAEITLLKMVDAGETYDTSQLYKRKERPNSGEIKDVNQSNTDFEDIMEYSYYKDYLFNGICFEYDENENLGYETQFRFGLKHGTGKEYDEKGNVTREVLYFNDQPIETKDFKNEENKVEKQQPLKEKSNKKSTNNHFLEKIDKLDAFENFTDIQIRNTQISVFCSAVWQLINADDKITEEEAIQFAEFAKEMGNKFMGDQNDKDDPVISELMQDSDKMIGVIKTFPDDELETFWDTLFSFAMVDGEFSLEEANLIAIIASGVYEELSDNEIKEWMKKRLKK